MLTTRNALSDDVLDELSKKLKERKLSVLAGSGISVDSDLPAWDELLRRFIIFCNDIGGLYRNEFPDLLIKDSKSQRSKDPIKVASVLKNQLNKVPRQTINSNFRRWFMQNFSNKQYNKNHEHIIMTDYPIILTSNYDTLLEDAAKKLGLSNLALNSVSFDSCSIIAKYIYEKIDCIIHIHGTWDDVVLENVVFTRDDYVKIMKNKPGFRMAIETIFIMNSILFVGYGMSDPHLEDLIEEVNINLDFAKENIKKFYVVVPKAKVKPVNKLFKEAQGVELLTIESYPDLTTFLEKLRKRNPRII